MPKDEKPASKVVYRPGSLFRDMTPAEIAARDGSAPKPEKKKQKISGRPSAGSKERERRTRAAIPAKGKKP